MKLQLDTTSKTIKIEDNVKLEKLIETLERLLPKGEWKQFTLETHTTIERWSSPVIIREYPRWHDYPWYSTSSNITYYAGSQSNIDFSNPSCLKAGTYNVEL